MSSTNVHGNISENQQQKLKHAVDTKSPVSIRLDYEDLCGSDVLAFDHFTIEQNDKSLSEWKRHHTKNE